MDQAKMQQVFQAIRDLRSAEERLTELGVLACNKSVDCQYAEWLACQIESGEPADSRSQPDWDVRLPADRKAQVKVNRKKKGFNNLYGHFTIWGSTIDNLRDDDSIICVLLGQDRSIDAYYRVPVRDVRALLTRADSQSGRQKYDFSPRWLSQYKCELPPVFVRENGMDSAASSIEAKTASEQTEACRIAVTSEPEIVTIQVPAYIWQALKELAVELGVTPECKLEEKIEEVYGPLCREYGDLTEEEKQGLAQHWIDRSRDWDDVDWGLKEDEWTTGKAYSPVTSS